MNLTQTHQNLLIKIEQHLDHILINENTSQELISAMRYSVLGRAKRIRPLLTLATGHMFGREFDNLIWIGLSVELIHSYSLVHDDLPAIDNDSMRRGQKSCHVKYSEATAILVGDILQTKAFEIISSNKYNLCNRQKLKLTNLLAIAAKNMVAGQMLDLTNNNNIDLNKLKQIHYLKTGCIIEFAIIAGYLSSDTIKADEYALLTIIAQEIGVLFQVVDDIIDVTSSSNQLGKTAKKDLANNKATFVNIMGLEGAQKFAQQTYQEILIKLNNFQNNEFLIYMLNIIYNRHN